MINVLERALAQMHTHSQNTRKIHRRNAILYVLCLVCSPGWEHRVKHWAARRIRRKKKKEEIIGLTNRSRSLNTSYGVRSSTLFILFQNTRIWTWTGSIEPDPTRWYGTLDDKFVVNFLCVHSSDPFLLWLLFTDCHSVCASVSWKPGHRLGLIRRVASIKTTSYSKRSKIKNDFIIIGKFNWVILVSRC